jgi:hypothetical protein
MSKKRDKKLPGGMLDIHLLVTHHVHQAHALGGARVQGLSGPQDMESLLTTYQLQWEQRSEGKAVRKLWYTVPTLVLGKRTLK